MPPVFAAPLGITFPMGNRVRAVADALLNYGFSLETWNPCTLNPTLVVLNYFDDLLIELSFRMVELHYIARTAHGLTICEMNSPCRCHSIYTNPKRFHHTTNRAKK